MPAIETWIDTQGLLRAVVVLLPPVALAFATGNPLWLRAALVTVSCFIAAERADLAPLGVALHGLAVIAGFLALFFAIPIPALFVVGCAAMAVAVIRLSGLGHALRSLGSFTFIPALYIACETAENSPTEMFVARALQILPFLAAAVLPVLALSTFRHLCGRGDAASGRFRRLVRLRGTGSLGARAPYGEAMIAVALAVATAATLVEWRHLAYGEWVIWSAVSVVTGDAATAPRKLRDRASGALVGVPAGIGLGLVLPHDTVAYGLVTLAAMLTIVAFRKYVQGFGARCACIGCAMVIANEPTVAAGERIVNVVLGGVIGILFVLATHRFASRRMRAAQ